MKYIVERRGHIVTVETIWQVVEVDAEDELEAKAKADSGFDEDDLRVLTGDDDRWNSYDETFVSEALRSEEYYRRRQLRAGLPYMLVFDDKS